ncbi:S-adenosyl-L-methionine-dependent methyltransferase [Marasmius fiardii PR-910]|nr:S-adenosyl-L-methionine-dependent methyltransferase [Marasmius fiardii PR-910]
MSGANQVDQEPHHHHGQQHQVQQQQVQHHHHHHHHHGTHEVTLPQNIQGDIATANKAYFDAHSHSYDDIPFVIKTTKEIGASIIETVPFSKEYTTVLEYACGTGLVSNELIPHCKSLIGVDISEGMIGQFVKRFEKQSLPPTKVRGICQELKGEQGELDGQTFDIVVCSMAYHHFDPQNLQNITNILASFLKPEGYLAVIDNQPNADGSSTVGNHANANLEGALGRTTGFSRMDMEGLFSESGLTFREYKHVTSFQPPGGGTSNVFIATGQKS